MDMLSVVGSKLVKVAMIAGLPNTCEGVSLEFSNGQEVKAECVIEINSDDFSNLEGRLVRYYRETPTEIEVKFFLASDTINISIARLAN